MQKSRKHYTPEEKLAILYHFLIEKFTMNDGTENSIYNPKKSS